MGLESIKMSLAPAQRDLSDNDIRIWFWERIGGIWLGLRIRKHEFFIFGRVKNFDFG